MQLLNQSTLSPGFGRLQRAPGPCDRFMTLIGWYQLEPEQRARQLDEVLEDAGGHPLLGDALSALIKPKVDLLLSGVAYAPNGRPSPGFAVTFRVGEHAESLAIIGDRHWQADGRPSPPSNIKRVELSYEKAFGGAGYAHNPIGRGLCEALPDGSEIITLPNIEHPERLIRSYRDRPSPAGFAPLASSWSPRLELAGTYDDKWLRTRWPEPAVDLQPAHYNAAPTAMQIDRLEGDELVAFHNLHPEHARFRAYLPGVRPRCFLYEPQQLPERFVEVPLMLDTLWVDAEQARLALIWRGQPKVIEPEHALLYLVDEATADPPGDIYHHRQALLDYLQALREQEQDGDVEKPEEIEEPPEPELDAETQQAVDKLLEDARTSLKQGNASPELLAAIANETDPAQFAAAITKHLKVDEAEVARLQEQANDTFKKLLKDCGHDPDLVDQVQEPSPEEEDGWSRERVLVHHQQGGSFQGEDLSGLDLSELDLTGADLRGALLEGAKLNGTRLVEAKLDDAVLTHIEANEAVMFQASALGADFTEAALAGADMRNMVLKDAVFEQAQLKTAKLTSSDASGVLFRQADLTGADLRHTDLTEAMFEQAMLGGVAMEGAKLVRAWLQEVRADGIDLSGVDLSELRGAEGAQLRSAKLTGCHASGSIWSGSDLRGADLTLTQLQGADLSGADLQGARLHGADMKRADLSRANLADAVLTRSNLFEAKLDAADLTRADLRDANLYAAELAYSQRKGTRFDGALLARTKLAPDAPQLPPGV